MTDQLKTETEVFQNLKTYKVTLATDHFRFIVSANALSLDEALRFIERQYQFNLNEFRIEYKIV